MAKLQNIIDVFFTEQWLFHPEVTWVYMAIHLLIQLLTI